MGLTTILDAFGEDDAEGSRLVGELAREARRRGTDVRAHRLVAARLARCVGCFDCWLSTPGLCRYRDDWEGIVRDVIGADTLILAFPSSFGALSSTMKLFVDRMLPLIQPFFGFYAGEIHHKPRYARRPKLLLAAIRDEGAVSDEPLLRTLAGRIAFNFLCPAWACAVRGRGGYAGDDIGAALDSLACARSLRPSFADLSTAAASAAPDSAPAAGGVTDGLALLIDASPKPGSSTSGAILDIAAPPLEEGGWKVERRKLDAALAALEPKALDLVGRTDLLVFAFPLYIDSLPYLLQLFLENLARPAAKKGGAPIHLAAFCNSGFPEAEHNRLAQAIIANFARRAGFIWMGSLALGAGGALSGGRPFVSSAERGLPPLDSVVGSIEAAGRALAELKPLGAELQTVLDGSPVPGLPRCAWNRLFVAAASGRWRREAKRRGVSGRALEARPFGDAGRA